MPGSEWYYVGQLGQLGPLAWEQVVELVEGGVITPETYVWRPGMPDWVEAGRVPELQPLFRSAAIPPPFPPRRKSRPQPMRPASVAEPDPLFAPTYGEIPSPRSRPLAGILQILLPGVGRLYLGYLAIGVLQILTTLCTCGVLWIWSFIDGLLILLGHIRYDGYGRVLID
jgi:hypothetical protein